MKTLLNGILALISVATIVSCGSNGGGGNNNATQTAVTPGSCVAGQVYNTTYGCLPQNNCPAGYGSYNNTCVQGTVGGYGGNGYGNCPAGQIYSPTYSTCLPVNNCSQGYGWYGSSCVYCGNSGYNSNPYYGGIGNTYGLPPSVYQPYYSQYGARWYFYWYKEQKERKAGR